METLDDMRLQVERQHHSIISEFSQLLDSIGLQRDKVKPGNLNIIFERLNQVDGAMELFDKVIIANEPLIMFFLNVYPDVKNTQTFQDLRCVVMYTALKYKPELGSFFTYTYKALKNHLLNVLRREKQFENALRLWRATYINDNHPQPYRPVENDVIYNETLSIECTMEILGEFLTPKQCEVIYYYITLDEKRKDLVNNIARCMGISPQRVRQLLDAARRNIHKVQQFGTNEEKKYLESIV